MSSPATTATNYFVSKVFGVIPGRQTGSAFSTRRRCHVLVGRRLSNNEKEIDDELHVLITPLLCAVTTKLAFHPLTMKR